MLRDILALYYASPFQFKIIVLDSSPDETQARNASCAANYAPLVEYVRYPKETHPRDKLRLGSALVETDFAMYAPDDDVFLLDGVDAALQFLRTHEDFAACHGVYYGASCPDTDRLKLVVEQAVVSHDLPTPFARIVSLFSRYQSIFYTVQRRNAFVAAANIPDSIESGHFFELFHACSLLMRGKLAALSVPYLLRNQQKGGSKRDIGHPMGLFVNDPDAFAAEYRLFCSELATRLQNVEGSREWTKMIDIAFALYFNLSFNPETAIEDLGLREALLSSDIAHCKGMLRIPNTAPLPSEELARYIAPQLASGWPSYG